MNVALVYAPSLRPPLHPTFQVTVLRYGGGRVYEKKTLRSNLAPEEGGGCLFEGGE